MNEAQKAVVSSVIDVSLALKAERDALLAENKELRAALESLVNDVQDYPAWQRPCYALDKARAALKVNP